YLIPSLQSPYNSSPSTPSTTTTPPPLSTLFPYTTLFRSVAQQQAALLRRAAALDLDDEERPLLLQGQLLPQRLGESHPLRQKLRSEEHTSELQSRGHLVCRLLLVKKKNLFMCINTYKDQY